MLRILIYTCLILFVINRNMQCSALGSYSGRNFKFSHANNQHKDVGKVKTIAGNSPGFPNHNAERRASISAWGIVCIVVSLVLAGMGLYYLAICYPIICQKHRQYDMVELHI